MYEALYRKYRPQTFDDVAGQEHITETLKRQVRTGRLSHAYLFIGTRGTGKTTCARILAKAVNCEHPADGNPCNECRICRGIDDGSILDVVELDAASNNGVDDVRMLRDEAIFSPAEARRRVYIIDEVHMLSKPAFNALLKILEEPPEHLMFILATTELNKVPATILSRCQRHSFRRLTPETIAKRLAWVAEQERIDLRPDAALLLGRLAEGGMRDGLSLLDQCSARPVVDTETVLSAMGLAGGYRTAELAACVEARDVAGALARFRALWQDGKDPSSLLGELAGFFRDALMLLLAPRDGRALLSGVFAEDMLRRSGLEAGQLLSALNIIQKYQAGLKDSPGPRLACELCLIELCGVPAAATAFAPPPAPAVQSAVPAREDTPAEPVSPPAPAEADARTEPAPPAEEQAVPPASPPVPAPPSDGAAPAASWGEALVRLQPAVNIGLFNILSDEFQVRGRVSDGTLTLEAMPGFQMNMLNHAELLETIGRCCGLRVRLEEMKAPSAVNDDKLGALGQFKNVTIR